MKKLKHAHQVTSNKGTSTTNSHKILSGGGYEHITYNWVGDRLECLQIQYKINQSSREQSKKLWPTQLKRIFKRHGLLAGYRPYGGVNWSSEGKHFQSITEKMKYSEHKPGNYVRKPRGRHVISSLAPTKETFCLAYALENQRMRARQQQ